jgi:hypothetical protein
LTCVLTKGCRGISYTQSVLVFSIVYYKPSFAGLYFMPKLIGTIWSGFLGDSFDSRALLSLLIDPPILRLLKLLQAGRMCLPTYLSGLGMVSK